MKLEWEKFENKIHWSWHEKLRPFIESEDCYNIYQELKKCKERVLPASENTWKAFAHTPYNELKAIFVGMSPYHTLLGTAPVADGLAFSTKTGKEPPSLTVLYNALEDNLGKKVKRVPDLDYWALQGVLLLNTSLTVKAFKADSHRELWQPFIKYLFTEVLDKVIGVPIVLFGKTAQEDVEKYLFPMSQPYLKVAHPAFYARTGENMEHKKLFTWCNKILGEIYWDWNDFNEKYLPF